MINRIILQGNLTKDPELRQTTSAISVVNFVIANNNKISTKDGLRDDVSFIECVAFGKVGENINKYFSKGRQILIEGRLKQEQWTDKDDKKRSKIQIIVERFEFLSSKGDESEHEAVKKVAVERDDLENDDVPF